VGATATVDLGWGAVCSTECTTDTGVLVGGTRVLVGAAVDVGRGVTGSRLECMTDTGVLAGGTEVLVGGTGVLVGGTEVLVGGTGVLVGGTWVLVMVSGTGVLVGVRVGSTGV
jgi:hypothetical protein